MICVNRISATYRDDIYCTAIAAGGVTEWDFAWEQYLKADSAQLQQSLRLLLVYKLT